MIEKPLVSCVINFFNAELFFEEAIQSVLDQTYTHWELFLIDDGSTDRSTTIAQTYAQRYSQKIRYLEHENHQNRGTSAARNLGIHHAKGVYVAFLDADDIWLPDKLEQQISFLEAQPAAGMVYGSLYYWYSWTRHFNDHNKDYVANILNFPSNTLLGSLEYLTLFVQEHILVSSPTCMIVRRDVVERVHGFEESFRGLFDDQVFAAKMALEAPVLLIQGVFEKYRKHPTSLTATVSRTDVHSARHVYLTWLATYIARKGIKDAGLWKALNRELLQYRHPRLYILYTFYRELIRRFESVLFFIARTILPLPVQRWLRSQWGA